MKVSLNLIKHIASEYKTGDDPYSFGVDEIVKRIGLQLGATRIILNHRAINASVFIIIFLL